MCPFYGHASFGPTFLPSNGNQCALIRGHSPCRMEVEGSHPNWDECICMNTEEHRPAINQLMEHGTIYGKDDSGLKLSEWFRRTMGREYTG